MIRDDEEGGYLVPEFIDTRRNKSGLVPKIKRFVANKIMYLSWRAYYVGHDMYRNQQIVEQYPIKQKLIEAAENWNQFILEQGGDANDKSKS